MSTAEWYTRFATQEVRGHSPTYQRLASGVAVDPVLLARLDALPEPKRQPNLLFGAVRYLDGPLGDYADPDTLRWLTALVWPEQRHRAARLTAAASMVSADPPWLVRGDLLTDLPALAAEAPPEATLVVYHTAVMAYLTQEQRDAFRAVVTDLPGHWLSNEGRYAFADLAAQVPPADDGRASGVLALDGTPLARSAPHGQWLHWLA
ncbi:MAG: DUF2332 family protein [Micromonosporaceae bacterium]